MSLREYYADALRCVLDDEGIKEPSEEYVYAVVDGILNARENESAAFYTPPASDIANQKIRDLSGERDQLKAELGRFYQEECPICHGRGDKPCDQQPRWYVRCPACQGSGKLWRVRE